MGPPAEVLQKFVLPQACEVGSPLPCCFQTSGEALDCVEFVSRIAQLEVRELQDIAPPKVCSAVWRSLSIPLAVFLGYSQAPPHLHESALEMVMWVALAPKTFPAVPDNLLIGKVNGPARENALLVCPGSGE